MANLVTKAKANICERKVDNKQSFAVRDVVLVNNFPFVSFGRFPWVKIVEKWEVFSQNSRIFKSGF
jgi:hypothetical protein